MKDLSENVDLLTMLAEQGILVDLSGKIRLTSLGLKNYSSRFMSVGIDATAIHTFEQFSAAIRQSSEYFFSSLSQEVRVAELSDDLKTELLALLEQI